MHGQPGDFDDSSGGTSPGVSHGSHPRPFSSNAHLWDVTGWKDQNYSNTQIQLFLQFFAGNGWVIGSTPIMNYDWEAGQWTIPLQLLASKTTHIGDTPLQVQVELNYYVEQPDAFGPAAMLGINITPVIPNYFYNAIHDLTN